MDKGPTRFNISKHAALVEPRATWENLGPLPSSEQAHLRGIVAHMRPALSGKQGARAAVLFAGPDRALMLMAAEVLGKDLKRPLYRIDLSAVVSEYIGETEKNLERLFDAAENGNWILFFDQADALFGKRSEVRDAHDRYANLEINYLLQRIEKYAGLVIIASNARDSIDEAFLRRLRFVVNFPMPAPGDRERIQRNAFPAEAPSLPDAAPSGTAYLAPGVYVEERTDAANGRIIGVETRTAAFLGIAAQGPVGVAETVLSAADFQRIYRTSSPAGSFLAEAVQGFFENGGKKCYVLRVKDRGTEDAFIAGLELLRGVELNILSAPGTVSDRVQQALLDHCSKAQDRVCILDPPKGATLSEVLAARSRLSSSRGFGALYYPWVMAKGKSNPPSGHVAGVYARIDSEHGVYKAPAGTQAVLSGVTGVERPVTDADQDALGSRGVNSIVTVPGAGVAVRGGRTLGDDPEWKYVHIRRTVIFLERSIEQGTRWVVFEPNCEATWARVRGSVADFLAACWRAGALQGTTAEQAFFVKCDNATMTPEDIAAGRVNCLIGVALVKPAEFMIIRIQQRSAASH